MIGSHPEMRMSSLTLPLSAPLSAGQNHEKSRIRCAAGLWEGVGTAVWIPYRVRPGPLGCGPEGQGDTHGNPAGCEMYN